MVRLHMKGRLLGKSFVMFPVAKNWVALREAVSPQSVREAPDAKALKMEKIIKYSQYKNLLNCKGYT